MSYDLKQVPSAAKFSSRSNAPTRVMIVDDSVVARRLLERILEDDGRFCVTGSHSSGEKAIEDLAINPCDLILLDLEMPGRGGIGSLPDLLAAGAGAAVVILSGHHAADGAVAIEALSLGARDVLTKPAAGHFHQAFASTLTDRLHALFAGEDKAGWSGPVSARIAAPAGLTEPPRAVAIGASTGGIPAMASFFAALGKPHVPIFVTQHLPPDFIPFFAQQLARLTCAPVEVARQGALVQAGRVYVAPGNAHLTIARSPSRHIEIMLSRATSRHGVFPAVDPMFSSLAAVYGTGACGLILSGMGRDGLTGAEAIVSAGGSIIAQDSGSSVVWGMPGAVVAAKLSSVVARPEEAARLLQSSWRTAP